MCGFGKDPGVAVGDDPDIEARHAGTTLQGAVVHLDLVPERGDQVPAIAPPRLAGALARRAVGGNDGRRGERAAVGGEPYVPVLEAQPGHAGAGAQLGAGRRGRRREQEIELGSHRHRDNRDGPLGCEVEIVVEKVELGAPIALLHGRAHVGREQLEPALDQSAAAGLVARQPLLLEHDDLEAPLREAQRGDRPGGAAADDGDVEHAAPQLPAVAKLAALTFLALPVALGWGGGGGRPARQFAQTPMDMGAMDTSDRRAVDAVHTAMSGPMAPDAHMVLSPPRPPSAADSARAADLVAQIRVALAKYRDVRVATAGGFRQFLPRLRQPVYHFTNWRWALEEMFRFNPAKPTSLLYRGNW